MKAISYFVMLALIIPVFLLCGVSVAEVDFVEADSRFIPLMKNKDISPSRIMFRTSDDEIWGICGGDFGVIRGERARAWYKMFDNKIIDISFSSGGEFLAAVDNDGVVKIWDDEKTLIRVIYVHEQDSKYDRYPYRDINNRTVSLSPDGRYVLSDSKLWNVTTGERISLPKELGWWLCFSADSKYILIWGFGILKLLDITTGNEVQSFSGYENTVGAAAISPDSRYILAGSVAHASGYLKLWSVATGEEVSLSSRHTDSVYQVVFSSDGKYAASASADGTVKVWNISDVRELHSEMHPKSCTTLICVWCDLYRIPNSDAVLRSLLCQAIKS